jgi:protein-disulfide isomerase
MAKFKTALDSGKFKEQVDKEVAEGDKNGAGGTPTFFINGQKLVGAQPVAQFKALIDAELAKKK